MNFFEQLPPLTPQTNNACLQTPPTLNFQEINDDCLLEIYKHLDIADKRKLAATSKRFRALAELPENWRRVTISGSIKSMTTYINTLLISRGQYVRELRFQDVRFPRALLLPSRPLEETEKEIQDFFDAAEKLVIACGSNLLKLVVEETTVSCGIYDLGSTRFFGPFVQHCKGLKELVLASSEDADYVGDHNVLLLSQIPTITSFTDGQAFGLSNRALCYIAEGFKDLKTLKVNTECKKIHDFFRIICTKRFRTGLTQLCTTHFHDNLIENIRTYCLGLSKMSNLEILGLDLQFTRFQDGLTVREFKAILDSCPKLHTVNYTTTLEAYTEVDNLVEDMEDLYIEEPDLPEIASSLSSFGSHFPSSLSSRFSDKKHQGYFADLEAIRELFAMRKVTLNLYWAM